MVNRLISISIDQKEYEFIESSYKRLKELNPGLHLNRSKFWVQAAVIYCESLKKGGVINDEM